MSLRRKPSKPASSQGGAPQYTPASFDPPHATFTPSLSKMTVSPSPSASLGCGGCGGKKKEHNEEVQKRGYDDDDLHVEVKKDKDGFEVVVKGKLSHDSSSDDEQSIPRSRKQKHHTPCSRQETPCGGRKDTPCPLRRSTNGTQSTDSPCSRMTSPCGSGEEYSPCSGTRPPTPPTPTPYGVQEKPKVTDLVPATKYGMGGNNDTFTFQYHIHFTDTEMDAFQYDLCKKTVGMIETMVEQKHRNAKSILIFGGDCVDIELRRKGSTDMKVSDVLTNLLKWKEERKTRSLGTVLMIGNRDGNKIRLSEHVDMIYPDQADSVDDIASKEFVVPNKQKQERMKHWITGMLSRQKTVDTNKQGYDKIMACFLRLCFIVNATMGATENFSKAVECQVCSGFMAYLFLKSKVDLDEKSLLYKIAVKMSGELERMTKLSDEDFGKARQQFTQEVTGTSVGFDLTEQDVREDTKLQEMLEGATKILETTRQWIGEGDMRKYLENGHVFYYDSQDEASYDVACVHAGMVAGSGEEAASVYGMTPESFDAETGKIVWSKMNTELGTGPTEFENQISHTWYTKSVEKVLTNNFADLNEAQVLDLKRRLVALAGPNNEGPLYTKDDVAKPFALEEDAAKPIAWFLGHQPNAVPMFGRSDSYNKRTTSLPSEKGLVVRTDTQYKRPSFCVAATLPYQHGVTIFGMLVEQAYAATATADNSAIDALKKSDDDTWKHEMIKFWCGPRVRLQNSKIGQTERKVYRTVMWNLEFSAGVFFVPDEQVEEPGKRDDDPFLTVAIGALVVKDSIFETDMMATLKTNENYTNEVGIALLKGMDKTLKTPIKMVNFELDGNMMAIPYICTSDDTKLGRQLAIDTDEEPFFKLK